MIHSNLSLSEVESIFRKCLPTRQIIIINNNDDDDDNNSRSHNNNNNDIIFLTKNANDFLQKEIATKDQKIADMEANALKTSEAIDAFYRQQARLFEEFVTLRKKYDDLKASMHKTLWDHCAPHHPDLRSIPPQPSSETTGNLMENEEIGAYGNYTATELLGEGQFATVRACTRPIHLSAHCSPLPRVRSQSHSSLSRRPSLESTSCQSLSAKSRSTTTTLFPVPKSEGQENNNTTTTYHQDPMAIKLIKKSKIMSMHFMRRLAAEVEVLDSLQRLGGDNKYVIRLLDAFQTPSYVCLVTERGSCDMFDLLRTHTEGLPEASVRSIAVELVRAVSFCHRNGICHRGTYVTKNSSN